MTERGKYIVIEGSDGTGKSTQVDLLAEWLKAEHNINAFIAHEPAGTPTADALRDIIKNGNLARDPLTDVLMFTAARREIWLRAQKKLKIGEWVLSARNYLSTEAYQGYGDGVDLALIRATTEQFIGNDYLTPDYMFILTLDDETERAKRIATRGELETPDTFEMRGQSFQSRANQAYKQIATDHGIEPINASASREDIQRTIRQPLGL